MNFSRIFNIIRKYAFPALLLALVIFLVFPWFGNALRWPGRILFFAALATGCAGLAIKLVGAFRKPKQVLFGSVALLLGCLVVYGFLELVAMVYLKADPDRNANPFVLTDSQREAIGKLVKGEPEYTTFDPKLGWAIKPDGVSADGRYQSNAVGFRANREYASEIPDGVTRVLSFGDSYTHGNSVNNDETWQHYAEGNLDGGEVLNFGVGAFGMAQAFLRYREFQDKFETDFVVIGCMTDNIRRTVNVYYPFRLNKLDATTFALAKPWASLDGADELIFHPNPLPSLDAYESFLAAPEKKMRQMAKQDLLFESTAATPLLTVAGEKVANADLGFLGSRLDELLNRKSPKPNQPKKGASSSAFSPDGEIFRINCRLFEEFVSEVEANGDKAVILWFPSPKDVLRYNERGTRVYQGFLDFFTEANLPFLDSLDWMVDAHGDNGKLPADTLFVEGHYAPEINRLIGEKLGAYLEKETRP